MIRYHSIKITLFYVITIGFILLNAWFVVRKDTLLMSALPLVLGILLLAVFSFDKIIYLIVFFAPVSLSLTYFIPWVTYDLYLPTEPLLAGITLLFLLKVIQERGFDKKILKHPVSIAIYIYIFWILITSLTSSMPGVSFKFLLARIWFIVPLYFVTTKIFAAQKNMEKFTWLYIAGFLIVIFYTIFRHAGLGLLDKQAAHYVVKPFYNDHTAYGAALALFIPFLVLFSFSREYSFKVRAASMILLGIFLTAFVLSYSRAAWVSMMGAIAVWVVIKLKIKFRLLFLSALIFFTVIFSFQSYIVGYLERNSDESSSDLIEHFSSSTNISTDVSNLERINRWNCAILMFQEKPFFGYGPGTYMFNYGAYQLKKNRTIISTNAGDKGNAHSEYLGALSESGIGGMATFLLVIAAIIYTAVHAWSRLKDKRMKGILLAALTGLITYYIHGFLNNFLDTDKLSVPFWGFAAMIVAADIYSRQKSLSKKNEPSGRK